MFFRIVKPLILHGLSQECVEMDCFFSDRLLCWYDENRRDLPWRDTRDPYIIWISEIILQQTRVSQGYDYFVRFIKRFPNVRDLAEASEDEVLRYWQGLGYYSRARNLHCAAKQVVAQGGFPHTYEEIRKLKGVGDYTAAAIASFAFGLPYAVVDGNVYRVLSRYYAVEKPIDTIAGKKYFLALASELLPRTRTADYNQAIMDFGALQCTPRAPQCEQCPLEEGCLAWKSGKVTGFPVKSRSLSVSCRYLNYICIKAEGQFVLFKREADDIWKGLYEPLLIETEQPVEVEKLFRLSPLNALLQAQEATWRTVNVGVKHQLSHRTLWCNFYLLDLPLKPDGNQMGRYGVWVDADKLSDFAVPRLISKLFEQCTKAE